MNKPEKKDKWQSEEPNYEEDIKGFEDGEPWAYEIGFNQALDLIGNKQIGLDRGEMKKIIEKRIKEDCWADMEGNICNYEGCAIGIIQALIDNESKIIKEVE